MAASPKPSEAPGVGPFYYKKGGFIKKTNKNALFMKRGPLLAKEKAPARNAQERST